nr:unnamed protein product [Digitaria exilis]
MAAVSGCDMSMLSKIILLRRFQATESSGRSKNKDGTFSTYECKRTATLLEVLNPSETFLNIVVDHPFGTWGVCFTYGTLFAMQGLVAAGRTYENSCSIRKACSFLLSKQLRTGGWGEIYPSSETEVINS